MNSTWVDYYTNELSQLKKSDGCTSYFLHIDEFFSVGSSGPQENIKKLVTFKPFRIGPHM